MKNKLRPLPKWLQLTLLLALMGLMVFCLWLEAHRPALSPRGALRQAEQQGLLEHGEFLTREFVFPDVPYSTADYFVAVSRTKGQLHMTEVWQDGLLWKPSERVLAASIEEPVTALLLPWQINLESNDRAYPAALVYCPQAGSIAGTLTIDGKTFSGQAGKGENGCWLLAFESLYDSEDDRYLDIYRSLWSWYYLHLPLHTPMTVTITVLDQNGGILAEKTLHYA